VAFGSIPAAHDLLLGCGMQEFDAEFGERTLSDPREQTCTLPIMAAV
jgi:hypothetical protein